MTNGAVAPISTTNAVATTTTFSSLLNLGTLVFVYLTLTVFFCYFVAIFVGRLFVSRQINVCGFGQDRGDLRGSFRYNAWVYRDENSTSDQRGKIRLGNSVAEYALNRYGSVDCGDRCWHVFHRTALGRPLAVRFDSRTYEVRQTIALDYGALDGLRLRETARLNDDWRNSQFTSLLAANEEERRSSSGRADARSSLASLSARYRYTVDWRTSRDYIAQSNRLSQDYTSTDFPRFSLVFTIYDNLSPLAPHKESFEFSVSGFRPSVAYSTDNGENAVGRLPPVSLIARDTRYDERILAARAVSNDKSTTGSTVNAFAYESSPCYDAQLGQHTAVPKPIRDLRFFERVYLRSVAGAYPDDKRDELTRSLDKFYVDCLYDSSDAKVSFVEEQLRPSVFGITAYLRVCPSNRPLFDSRKLICVERRVNNAANLVEQ